MGIILLFILTSVSTTSIGFNDKTMERDELLDNLAFYYYDEYGSSKFEYYKEYFQSDNSEIADLEEITTPVEPPQTSVSSGPMDSAWPMQCHDLHHTSRSPYSTVNITGLEKWRFRCGNVVGGGIDGGPIIGDDGAIYFGDKDYYVYAIFPNGTLKWNYKTGGGITSAPALAEDRTLYVGTMGLGSNILAVNPNGTEKWRYHTGYYITCDPVIGDDGTIYIGSGDTYFYAMNPNGTLKWRFKTGDYIKGPASIAADGTVYIGSFDDYLYALYPNNGTMKWKCNIWKGTDTNPSIASDGTIYVCSSSKMFAIYPNNGTKRWTYDFSSGRHIGKSSQAISADGTIYVGTNIGETSGGDIIAVNPDGTERWRKLIADEWVDSSPCIAEDGTVYIGSQSEGRGFLHAFGPVESNSPPETPTISGTTNGKVRLEYWYKIGAVDPDNNPVSFYIEWGDGTHTGWTSESASGEKWYYEHTWYRRGNYTIRGKAKDPYEAESEWGELEVTMPMNQQSQNWWFLQFLQDHPRMFPILRQTLERWM